MTDSDRPDLLTQSVLQVREHPDPQTKAAGSRQFVCLQDRGPCGFWWEQSDGVQIFQRTRMLPDGREHPLLSPQGIWRVGRVLEVITPEERPRT